MDTSETELENLLKDLQKGTDQERRYAAEDLGYGKYQQAIPALVKGLADDTIAVSEACSNALIRIGGEEVAKSIIPALSTEDVRLRNYVVEILSLIGEVSIPILKTLLEKEERDVRIFAVDILTKIRSPHSIDALLHALNDNDINVASTAADGLGDIASEEHIATLLEHMNSDAWMRCSILRGISRIGGKTAMEAVLPYTDDSDMLVKFSAIKALGKIGIKDALLRLLEILQYDDISIYGGETINAILKILTVNPEYEFSNCINEMNIPALLKVTRCGSTSEKIIALQLLGRSKNSSAVDELILFFSDKHEAIRTAAVEAILQIDPKDLSPLVKILNKNDALVEEKRAALECMGKSSSQENYDVIKTFLHSDDPIVQKDVLDAIHGDFRPIPVNEVIALLEKDDKEVKISAANAMRRLGSAEFIHPLVKQLTDPNKEIHDAIDHALTHLGDLNASPLIQPYLESFSQDERRMAFEYFGLHHPETIIDKFFEGLQDPNSDIRVISFKVISNLKKGSFEVIEKGLMDTEENVRVEAARAINSLTWNSETLSFLKENLLKTQCERVKVELIQLIGRLATPEIVNFLVRFLNDTSPWVQLETVEALKVLGDPSVIDPLKKLLNSESIDLIEAVETTISELDYR